MRSQKGKSNLFLLFLVFISLLIPSIVFASEPRIVSITMLPAAPNFGDRITVTIVYCGDINQTNALSIAVGTAAVPQDARLSGIGQVFIVSQAGINVHTSVPAASPGGQIGLILAKPPGPANCLTCAGANDGQLMTVTYGDDEMLTMPDADYFPGCSNTNLYIHAVMKSNGLYDGENHNRAACQVGSQGWVIPTLPTSMSIRKSMTGVLQLQNDLMLVSVDYTYANGLAEIRETIPNLPGGGATWTLQSIGPLGMYTAPCVPPCPVTPGQGITWTLPDRRNPPGIFKGSVTGTVWFLLKVTGANPGLGTPVLNTANSVITGPNGNFSDSSPTSIIAGQPAITVVKSQSSATPLYGDKLTYYLEYQINGSALVAYQPFDDIAVGTYGPLSVAPPGWQYRSSLSNGTWYVEDVCGTGDRVIRGDTSALNDYPGLLYSGYPMITDTSCYGIVQSEVLVNPAGGTTGSGYEGADSLVVIRDDGLAAGGRAYGLVLSVDNFIGTNNTGHVGFQRCGATPYGTYTAGTCMWPASVDVPITGNKWYKVKIQTGPGNPCAFSAKVWIKGDPEPGANTISWTDANCIADGFQCSGSGKTWYAGIAEQGGDNALTQDSYNNFMLLKPRVSADTELYDTVPTGLIAPYWQQGPDPMNITPTGPGTLIGWDLGTISDEGGSFTWSGVVNTCNPITNISAIDGADPIIPVLSNDVVAVPICPEIVGITKTVVGGLTQVSLGQVFTWQITYCNTGPGPITNYKIWDTVPATMFYQGCSGGTSCGAVGGIVTWNIASPLINVAVGACPQGTVRWWGRVDGPFPLNPFVLPGEIYASAERTEYYIRNYMLPGVLK